MSNLNITAFEGRITADPELGERGETKFVRFNVAVDDGWGEKKKTHFIPVVTFGKSAEFMAKYITKGDLISVAGKITQSKWTDKDGNQKSAIGVEASNVYIAHKKEPKKDQGPSDLPDEIFPF